MDTTYHRRRAGRSPAEARAVVPSWLDAIILVGSGLPAPVRRTEYLLTDGDTKVLRFTTRDCGSGGGVWDVVRRYQPGHRYRLVAG